MWAVLGTIEFKLLAAPTTLDTTYAADYAEHSLINRKPRLQFTGLKTDDIKIDLTFHIDFCDPEAELEKLNEALSAHISLALVYGNGKYAGEFVITEIVSKLKHTAPNGKVLLLDASVTLREYPGDPAKPKAPAVRPVSQGLPIASLASPKKVVENSIPGNVSGQVSSLALAVSSAKSALSTSNAMATAISSINGAALANPVAALSAINKLLSNKRNYLSIASGVAGMAALSGKLNLPQIGLILPQMREIEKGVNIIKSFQKSIHAGNLIQTLATLDRLGSGFLKSGKALKNPLAALAALAATRGI
jgi:phage protein U